MKRKAVVGGAIVLSLGFLSLSMHAQTPAAGSLPSSAELAQKREALIAQCPAQTIVTEEEAGKRPIHVTRWGDQGPRIVLIHGGVQGKLGGGPATFDKQEVWGHEGFRVERVDRPGFGQSPTRGDDDMDRDAVWIADMLGSGANPIGHSWGGAEALLAAARAPQAVLSLVLVEPALAAVAEADPALRDSAAVRTGAAQRNNVLMTVKTPAEYGVVYSKMLGADSPAGSNASGSVQQAGGLQPQEAAAMGCALLKGQMASAADLQKAIDTIAAAKIPVLIVTGGWNAGFDAAGDVLARLLHGEHIIVRSPNHFVQLSNATDFNEKVGSFMRAADERRTGAAAPR